MAKDEAEEQQDPSVELSRDETGRYLHLKLKRFASIKELNMSYAKKTWKQTPHDAEVDIYCAIFKVRMPLVSRHSKEGRFALSTIMVAVS